MPELEQRHGLGEIERVVREGVAKSLDESRIVIRVPLDTVDGLRDHLAALARDAGFEGRVLVLGDQMLGPSDVRVEWSDGAAERVGTRLWADMSAIVARMVDGIQVTASSPGATPGSVVSNAA
jgi:flagellar assembly protein FliH